MTASVLFCIAVGVALIGVPNKDGLLQAFQNLTDALLRVTSGVVKLAPYGIFAITANAAGTLRLEELGRLQVFLWVYVLAWAILLLLVLPALVAWGTPFTYREVMKRARTPVITGIATGSVLVVLPMIAERCKELLEEKKMDHDDAVVGITLQPVVNEIRADEPGATRDQYTVHDISSSMLRRLSRHGVCTTSNSAIVDVQSSTL